MLFQKKIKKESNNMEDINLLIEPYQKKVEEKMICIKESLITVNELLEFMTNLDYVREMILDANNQAKMVEVIAASSEEMAAATDDISNFVQESNANMQQAMSKTEKCLIRVDNTFKKIEKNINEIYNVKEIMVDLSSEAAKINELINVIKTVADQTNLLSLNASIEAARVGEHGRGFGVVADEIKKLAESTKEQVDIIREVVNGLNGKMDIASSEIERVVNTFNASKQDIDESTGGIKEITTTLIRVQDRFTSILANVEEQTATTEEMSSNLQIINEKSERLRVEADRTGQAFYDISQKIDGIRLKALSCSDEVDNSTMIHLSITDHLMWKWRVYNMILGYVHLDITTVGDHNDCRLGKWLASLNTNDSRIKNLLNKIEPPHCQIHKHAYEAIQAYNSGNKNLAEDLLIEIEKNSKIVVNLLMELKTVSQGDKPRGRFDCHAIIDMIG